MAEGGSSAHALCSINTKNKSNNAKPCYEDKVYLVVTDPRNSIAIDAVRQLALLPETSQVYLACPPSQSKTANMVLSRLQRRPTIMGWSTWNSPPVKLVWFDPQGTNFELRESAQSLIKSIISSEQRTEQCIDGVMLYALGATSDREGIPNPGTGLVKLAEHKLLGNNVLVDALLQFGVLRSNARVAYDSTESARGLVGMGFPVPRFHASDAGSKHGKNDSSSKGLFDEIVSRMDGSAYSDSNPYNWKHSYSYLSAILVLYVAALARKHPNIYFASVSPGMTEESLNPDHTPDCSLKFKLYLWIMRYLFFWYLKRLEIAHNVEDGAKYLVEAVSSEDWKLKYPKSGTFVGALRGTGGPIGDQFDVPNGAFIRDKELQDASYKAVQSFLCRSLNR